MNFLANFSQRIGAKIRYFAEDDIHRFFPDQLSAGKEHFNEDQFFRALTEVSVLTFWCGRSKVATYEPRLNWEEKPGSKIEYRQSGTPFVLSNAYNSSDSSSFSIAESSASGISSALTVPITLPTTCT